ncbi:hypothetical protein IAD21_04093 [Abditibacteriota bacterium]|nr:hypothetical protein IAD21_04093 [Abditibacteriota bacterium]
MTDSSLFCSQPRAKFARGFCAERASSEGRGLTKATLAFTIFETRFRQISSWNIFPTHSQRRRLTKFLW